MKNLTFILIPFLGFIFFLSACNDVKKDDPVSSITYNDSGFIHENMKALTDVIVLDVFSPPVAGRIYAYSCLAQYEAIRFEDSIHFHSIADKMNGFSAIPRPEKGKLYNFSVCSISAFISMALHVVFLKDSLIAYRERALAERSLKMDKETFDRSVKLGDSIGNVIWARALKDNYKESRGYPRYMVSREEGKWKPTAPDYQDAMEPFWNTIKCMVMDSASQFKPAPPNEYSTKKESKFFKELIEVYQIVNNLSDTQKIIAQYWDDNPFTINHKGHLTFSTKKVTPGGHWLGITAIACKKNNFTQLKSAQAYALVSIGLFEGFISCWDEKFRTNAIRPLTAVNDLINRDWQPFLQTPPFPEYTSGHSVVSGASSIILTHLFGEDYSFSDTSELEYIGLQRDFTSFGNAAQEASVSRLYGGIHYRNSIETGLGQGKKIGNYILKKILNTGSPE